MKKILALLAVIFVAAFSMLAIPKTLIAHAEEEEITNVTEVTEVTNDEITDVTNVTEEEEIKTLKAKINELLAKIQATDEYQWFNTYVMPALAGAGSAVLSLIITLFPRLKTNARYKQLQGAYAQLEESYNNIKDNLSVEAIHKTIEEVLGKEIGDKFEEALKTIALDEKKFAEVSATVDTLSTQIGNLIDAAKVVWGANAKATQILAGAPTVEALNKETAERIKLENYIRTLKGEEAELIIAEIKG